MAETFILMCHLGLLLVCYHLCSLQEVLLHYLGPILLNLIKRCILWRLIVHEVVISLIIKHIDIIFKAAILIGMSGIDLTLEASGVIGVLLLTS